jgi:RHH-type proline utilization regulon transcriptional repressor/proline dehydrogenase/delta 1-pyrroline-5-carboxylate dehydrogenase
VVSPREFEVAIAYLTRRLEEIASPENFMSGVFELTTNKKIFIRERDRFLASVKLIDKLGTAPNRKANNSEAAAKAATKGIFVNQPDSDPAIVSVRENAKNIQKRSQVLAKQFARTKNAGLPLLDKTPAIDKLVKKSLTASAAWAQD